MAMNKKGYIYTLTAIVLILILVLFIAYYSRFTETEIEDVSGKMRCDELHFFVEDTKVDLERGLMITGRRGAIYAISNQIIGQSMVQPDYRFNCTPGCTHCSFFNYSGQGAEAAIAELMFCGTLYGRTNEYMLNHSLEKWLYKLEVHASAAGYSVSIMPTSFKLSPYDAFNLSSSLNLTVNISDATELCYFSLYSVTIDFMTNVDGLEDPFYNDNTGRKVAKAVHDCTVGMHATEISEGSKGWGWVVGSPVLINNVSDTSKFTSADKSKIIILNYDNFPSLLNGSYDTDLMNYGGIITNWDNSAVTNALDRINIPYLAGTSIYEITEDMRIILLASKYYFIDISPDVNGTCDSCVIYHEDGTCLITQGNWFTSRSQTDSDGHYPIGFLFSESPCKISPQLKTNHTWNYNLYYPVKVKNVHLIASSYVTGDYNVTLTYFDGTNNISYVTNIRLCGHCDAGVCADNGTYYDSHYISKNKDPTVGGAFSKIFWNVTSGGCGNGETVQHITIKSSDISNYPLSGISITDPYNESPANDTVIWAITIEMAPMSVWKLNAGVENYTSSSLFMCYNVSSSGPSFFDRVEGNLNTTDKYQSQTNNTIGLESFLSIERLHYYGVNVFFNSTAMDYQYFGDGETGYSLIGANESGIDYFRIDPNNAISYGVYDLINWNDYSLPTLGNCSSTGGYCQPTSGIECCGALVCFDYYYFDSSNFTCHNCLSPGQYCNISDTLYHTWCCSPKQCSAETHTCCAASETNCSNGLDDDCDGLRDCCDSNLAECGSMPYCTAIESSNISFCNDSIDNNCNNLTDCNDITCKGVCPYCKLNTTEVNCTNGIDEDCDTLIDCNDTLQCFGCPFCPKAENLNCTNGIDDNCNGLKDCCDSAACSCVLPQVCSNVTCGCITPGLEICGNGIDDNANGLIDCKDPACNSTCTSCQNSACSNTTYQWICTNKCPGTNTSCGCTSCTNCNTNGTGAGRTGDGCLNSSYIDYYCSGISCTYSSKSCPNCSCSCGGYNATESTANGNCADGIDNNCNGKTDGSDPGCDATPPIISGVQQDKPFAWTTSSTTQDAIHSGLNTAVNVRANITDASGMSSVKLYYKVSATKPASRAGFSGPITMSLSGLYYQTVSAILKRNNKHIWYYINATDNSANKNWATSPTNSAPPNFWTYHCA